MPNPSPARVTSPYRATSVTSDMPVSRDGFYSTLRTFLRRWSPVNLRLEAHRRANLAAFDVKRSEAARKGHEARKAKACRSAAFLNDPMVKRALAPVPKIQTQKRTALRSIIYLRDGPNCHYCKRYLQIHAPERNADFATLEHLNPRSAGGSNELSNLVLACQPCNVTRGGLTEKISARVREVAANAERRVAAKAVGA